ncbi:MAG: hypothetical protein N3G21_03270 [Candidatus Hydrogenedentes bacterium]|nr:hypothetical protein [Candidatus Hydrogenedentota bacterium]
MLNGIKTLSTLFGLLLLMFCAYAENSLMVVYPAPGYEYIFGVVYIGESIVKDVVVMNQGSGLLRGSAVVKMEQTEVDEGEGDSDEEKNVIQIVSDPTFALAEGEQSILKIRFAPIKEKVYKAKLVIEASENQRAEIPLLGIGKKKAKSYYLLGCGVSNYRGMVPYSALFDLVFCVIVLGIVHLKKYKVESTTR